MIQYSQLSTCEISFRSKITLQHFADRLCVPNSENHSYIYAHIPNGDFALQALEDDAAEN